jgi:hypothetical protein
VSLGRSADPLRSSHHRCSVAHPWSTRERIGPGSMVVFRIEHVLGRLGRDGIIRGLALERSSSIDRGAWSIEAAC